MSVDLIWQSVKFSGVHVQGMKSLRITSDLIAPCGMNCGICKAYLAFSRGLPAKRGSVTHCSGCRIRNKNCYIKRGCKRLLKNETQFCFDCEQMPCENLDRLDRRYRMRYSMSMVDNLKEIKNTGLSVFLENQKKKYECSSCGDVFSVHDGKCYSCGKVMEK